MATEYFQQDQDDGLDSMDIDEPVQPINNNAKRLFNDHEKSSVLSNECSLRENLNASISQTSSSAHKFTSQLPSSSQRTVLKARRKFSKPSYICVIDTNVLLDNLDTIKLLITSNKRLQITKTRISDSTPCDTTQQQQPDSTLRIEIDQIVVPWVVFQELDGLKMMTFRGNSSMKESPNWSAQTAIKFLNEQLKLTDSLIKGEPELSREQSNRSNLTIESNDDKILEFCIHLDRQYKSSNQLQKCKVVLLSNDRNLQNKALVHNISSYSMEEFANRYLDRQKLKFSFNTISAAKSVELKVEENKETPQEISQCSSKSVKRLKSEKTVSPSSGGIASQLVSNIRRKLVKSRNSVSTNSATTVTSSAFNKQNNKAQSTEDVSSEDINTKYELERSLLEFIVKQLTDTYGEQWESIFPKFRPHNATLYDSLYMLKNNWFGVFSDYFDRNKLVLDLVKELIGCKNVSNQASLTRKWQMLLDFVRKQK